MQKNTLAKYFLTITYLVISTLILTKSLPSLASLNQCKSVFITNDFPVHKNFQARLSAVDFRDSLRQGRSVILNVQSLTTQKKAYEINKLPTVFDNEPVYLSYSDSIVDNLSKNTLMELLNPSFLLINGKPYLKVYLSNGHEYQIKNSLIMLVSGTRAYNLNMHPNLASLNLYIAKDLNLESETITSTEFPFQLQLKAYAFDELPPYFDKMPHFLLIGKMFVDHMILPVELGSISAEPNKDRVGSPNIHVLEAVQKNGISEFLLAAYISRIARTGALSFSSDLAHDNLEIFLKALHKSKFPENANTTREEFYKMDLEILQHKLTELKKIELETGVKNVALENRRIETIYNNEADIFQAFQDTPAYKVRKKLGLEMTFKKLPLKLLWGNKDFYYEAQFETDITNRPDWLKSDFILDTDFKIGQSSKWVN